MTERQDVKEEIEAFSTQELTKVKYLVSGCVPVDELVIMVDWSSVLHFCMSALLQHLRCSWKLPFSWFSCY